MGKRRAMVFRKRVLRNSSAAGTEGFEKTTASLLQLIQVMK